MVKNIVTAYRGAFHISPVWYCLPQQHPDSFGEMEDLQKESCLGPAGTPWASLLGHHLLSLSHFVWSVSVIFSLPTEQEPSSFPKDQGGICCWYRPHLEIRESEHESVSHFGGSCGPPGINFFWWSEGQCDTPVANHRSTKWAGLGRRTISHNLPKLSEEPPCWGLGGRMESLQGTRKAQRQANWWWWLRTLPKGMDLGRPWRRWY